MRGNAILTNNPMIKQKGEQDALTLAKEALEKTDKEKFPKLYKTREDLVNALELAQNQKIRAEKAEKKAKVIKPQEKDTPKEPTEKETPKISNLSLEDIRALNDVHDEDVKDVQEWAKFKGVSLAEAKKDPHIVSLLKEKSEARQIAEATNTGKGRHGTSKATGKELLRNFEKTGELPESDEDMKKLVEAQYPTPK